MKDTKKNKNKKETIVDKILNKLKFLACSTCSCKNNCIKKKLNK
ncbi:hypothetical protein [Methanocaldococcus fervens]|nr:hypothetical protein [Methanocaldococcus fervens]